MGIGKKPREYREKGLEQAGGKGSLTSKTMGASEGESLSVNTEDAIDVVARIDFIVASLEKAGVPPEELHHFKQVVSRLQLASATSDNDVPDDGVGHQQQGVVAEGLLEKLQKGTQGFAPVWKSRWVRILPGELQVFESASRPEHKDTPYLFSLPLSVQQTRIDPGKGALCKKLGREAILMVSSTTAARGTLRCFTLATKDNLALEKWTSFLEKAMSQEGHVAGSSIFRASQVGDILRVKELVSRGVGVNRTNPYGCVALHYAVKYAAESAALVARGGDGAGADQLKIRAQEALRVVVLLMSHGADARAVNHLGETPLDLGSRLTSGFPKSRALLLSILDSSKYQISGGTIFIVPGAAANKPSPGQQFLASIREDGAAIKEDDEAAAGGSDAAALKATKITTTTGGVTFSPSRRKLRAKKRYEIAKSRLPYVSSSAAPSFGEGRCRSTNAAAPVTPALPRGDHEVAFGGVRHRLAAGHGARCSRNDRGGSGGEEGERYRHQQGTAAVGVHFKNYRMGSSSGVLVGGSGSKRRRRACSAEGVVSCSGRAGGVRRSSSSSDRTRNRNSIRGWCSSTLTIADVRGRPRPTTSSTTDDHGRDNNDGRGREGVGFPAGSRRQRQRQRQQILDGNHLDRGQKRPPARRRARKEEGGERGLSLPDSEARRQILEWLRESAGTASAVPPATAHVAGEHLVETSSYVATGRRSDVYRALHAIKGDGRGELISAERLRTTLCRVGQPLSPNEMNELLQEADPTGTGYVSCSRLSKLVVRERLTPLAAGSTYNEEDDVVLHAKARRLAREKRLERAAAIAQRAVADAGGADLP